MSEKFDKLVSTNSSNTLNFNAEHNGIRCIASLEPEDKRTAKQFRFTAAMLAVCFQCKSDTIRARVQTLINTGDLNETENLVSLNVPNQNGNGAVKTTLYDLDVFNKLAMTFIDNQRAVEVRKAFNDVLVKHETGTVQNVIPQDYESALVALLERVRENKQLESEKEAAQKALAMEIDEHLHDRLKDNGRCGGYVKNRNHYRNRTTDLSMENTMLKKQNSDLKDENQVLERLAECNPTKTVAQWLRAKKRSFSAFHIPSDGEGRVLFYRAYERYAKWLNDIYKSREHVHVGGFFGFDDRKQAYVMSWSLVCVVNSGEIADVPEAYDLLKYLR